MTGAGAVQTTEPMITAAVTTVTAARTTIAIRLAPMTAAVWTTTAARVAMAVPRKTTADPVVAAPAAMATAVGRPVVTTALAATADRAEAPAMAAVATRGRSRRRRKLVLAVAVAQTPGLARLLLLLAAKPAEEVSPAPATGFLASLRRGDHDAWRSLFEAESATIHRYAFSRLGRAEDAEDVTNQVFEEAWRSMARYRDEGLPLRAWLFGIARNLAASHRRRFMGRNAQVSIDALQIEGRADAAQTEMLDLVRALASIDPGQAETISLRYIHGLSLIETANVLGTTVDGVKGRQQRALAALKQRLGWE
jgi:RNA polymerase sigma factor (sigma-70 family)